jgi:hypothetical protein
MSWGANDSYVLLSLYYKRMTQFYNIRGQLGTGDREDKMKPSLSKDLEKYTIIDVACGSKHSLFLGCKFAPNSWKTNFILQRRATFWFADKIRMGNWDWETKN